MKFLKKIQIVILLHLSIFMGIDASAQVYLDTICWIHVNDPEYASVPGADFSLQNNLNSILVLNEVVYYEQALPFAKTPELLKIHEIRCNSNGNINTAISDLISNFPNVFDRVSYFEEPNDTIMVYDPIDYIYTDYIDWIWHLPKIQAAEAWDITRGDPNIKTAVLDTKFDIDHPDLNTKIYPHYDPFSLTPFNCATTTHFHGTAVASFVAAETTEQGGTSEGQLAAIGFNTMMIGYHSRYDRHDFLKKILHASNEMNADVIVSCAGGSLFCSPDPDSDEDLVVKEILDNGTVIVMAAGNGSTGTHCGSYGNYHAFYPLNPVYDERIIVVTSTDINDNHGFFDGGTDYTHSHFADVDICSPGYDVFAAKPTDCDPLLWPYHNVGNGTSYASPIVAGVCALLKSINPDFTPGEIQHFIKSTADPVTDASSYPGMVGAGRINAFKAVQMANDCSPIIIDTDTEWNSDMIVVCGIEVLDNATLTISSEIKLSKHSQIIIKQGGSLVINGGTLTSLDNDLWQGIQVWGNKTAHQYPDIDGDYQQGLLELRNGAVIENAIIAIDLWEPENYASTGGIVSAKNSTFRNNVKSIHALHYTNHHPVSGDETDYNSSFSNCTFEITEDYFGDETFYKHVDLAYVKGIRFSGCDFSLDENATNVSNYNHGIAGYDAGFRVYANCTSQQSPCPEEDYDRCTFTGFWSAISAVNDNWSAVTFSVDRADFINNAHGVRTTEMDNASVLFSDFKVGSFEDCGYGIFTDAVTGFAFEENQFAKYPSGPTANYFGISINNSNAVNDVYKNDFDGLSYANHSGGQNWANSNEFGLEYLCNTNTNNYADFYVANHTSSNPSGIQLNQGSEELMAGNSFSLKGATWHFYNGGAYHVDYYTDAANTPLTPEIRHEVYLQVSEVENNCPSHYGGGSGVLLSLSPQQKIDTEQEYYDNLNDYNNTKVLYDNYVDGGSTEAEILDIQTAQAGDMWALRAQLLGDSPHLSFEVLKEASDKTDVFTESALFDILAANPDELKKDTLISYLENKEEPLPDYMIALLNQLASGITYKTALQKQMAGYKHTYTRAAHDMIRSILNDTVMDYTGLRNWLDNIGGITSDRQIISSYLAQGNFTDAFTLANLLPDLYNLTGTDSIEHLYYMDMLNLYQTLDQQGRNTFQLDSIEKTSIIDIANNSTGVASKLARSILEAVYNEYCHTCSNVDGSSGYKADRFVNPNLLGKSFGLDVSVKPNPAKEWAAFDYSLLEKENNGKIVITNAAGTIVNILHLTANKGQVLLDTRKLPAGIYVYSIKCSGFSKSGKLVISK